MEEDLLQVVLKVEVQVTGDIKLLIMLSDCAEDFDIAESE